MNIYFPPSSLWYHEFGGVGKLKEYHPVIVSASRRTDIPAFFGEWFLKIWKRGYTIWRNPFNPKDIRKVFFDKTRIVVFWSKFPEPFINFLKEINTFYYFHFTLNDYPHILEPNLPHLQRRLSVFKKLSSILGEDRIIWRYDPIIISKNLGLTIESILKKIDIISKELEGYTTKLFVSFLTSYRKVIRRFEKKEIDIVDLSYDEKKELLLKIHEIVASRGIELHTCAEPFYDEKIIPGSCVDPSIPYTYLKNDPLLQEYLKNSGKDKGQRKLCKCWKSVDIGFYNTCPFLCTYCYAHDGIRKLKKTIKIFEE